MQSGVEFFFGGWDQAGRDLMRGTCVLCCAVRFRSGVAL